MTNGPYELWTWTSSKYTLGESKTYRDHAIGACEIPDAKRLKS